MPFPSEETTAPITNTYFVMDPYDTGKGLTEQIAPDSSMRLPG